LFPMVYKGTPNNLIKMAPIIDFQCKASGSSVHLFPQQTISTSVHE
jgi:hypothetical protein